MFKHGLRYHPLYGRWRGMVARCTNPKHKSYRRYGGRGIKVCERWLGPEGIKNYIPDIETLGPKPSPRHTLDRS
jgi:hypothetical protein